MHSRRTLNRRRRSLGALALLEALESRVLMAVTTYDFASYAAFSGGGKNGTGAQPQSLVLDPLTGDLYGTTGIGGAKGYGTVFKIAAGTNTIIPLVSFTGKDGIYPRGSLAVLTDGQGTHVYGITSTGGTKSLGTVFDVTVSGTSAMLTTLINFTGPNGSYPLAGLVEHGGNLYGTTNGAQYSGQTKSNVFEVIPDGTNSTLTVLGNFNNVVKPFGTLVVQDNGDIFGTTTAGGKQALGSVFEIAGGSGIVTTLASFTGPNGQYPYGGLVEDALGNIFGITSGGGANNLGTIFKIDPSGGTASTITRITSFGINMNGNHPVGNLILDSGLLYGSTAAGGNNGTGTVFRVDPTIIQTESVSNLTTLFNFRGDATGVNPTGTLVMDATGKIFGDTYGGGPGTINRGTVFELIPTGTPQEPVKIDFQHQPSNAVAGQSIAPAIVARILDVFGNVVTADNANVTLEIHTGPAGASLGGTFTVAAVNGIATFSSAFLDKAGTYTINATDGVRTSPDSIPFSIRAAAPAQLEFKQVPATSVVGKQLIPAVMVKIEDAFGNVVTTDTSKVTLAINTGPGGAILGGPRTISAINGIATFINLTLNIVGDYTLTATDGVLTAATSDSIRITQTTMLVFSKQPAGTTTGSTLTPAIVVKIENPNGQVIATDNSAVTLVIFSGPTGAVLSGTVTVNAVNGVATFADLSLNLSGTYTLEATDAFLTPAVSNSFKIR